MLVEGTREVSAALEHSVDIREVFHCDDLVRDSESRHVLASCRSRGIHCTPCSEAVFRKLVYRENPGGLIAVARTITRTIESLELSGCPLLLIAVSLEKPGNLGAILRVADAANVDAVVVCDACTDTANPNVVRASAGALFSVPVATAGTDDVLAWLRKHKIAIVAARPDADRIYTDQDWTPPTAIALGTESQGLTERWMREADAQVRIPMQGRVDSLNVSTVASVLTFEALRQRDCG